MDLLLEKPIAGTIGKQLYKVNIEWRNGIIIADEPTNIGGGDLGPDPYTLLLSSLAACTLSTLRMYINKKGWNIPEIFVTVNMYQLKDSELITTIIRDISFSNSIATEQSERLLTIAQKCPVSKILENKININTTI